MKVTENTYLIIDISQKRPQQVTSKVGYIEFDYFGLVVAVSLKKASAIAD